MEKTYPFILEKYVDEPVSLGEAREWLRMDVDGYEDEDNSIESALTAAIAKVEHDLDATLCVSTYQWNTWCFPCDFGGKNMVRELISISYHDGTEYVVLPTNKYSLVRTGELRSKIYYGDNIPEISTSNFPVQVVFTAGYELGSIPENILQAVRALTAEFFDNRGDGVSEKRTLSDKLIDSIRIPFPA